jgi:hypothetical protein
VQVQIEKVLQRPVRLIESFCVKLEDLMVGLSGYLNLSRY